MTPAYPPPPSAWKRWFQLAGGGNQTSMLIAGVTVIWTRQKATGTGVVKNGGNVKVFAAIEVAVMEITSRRTRLESLVQLSATAGAAKVAVEAASAKIKPQDLYIFARLFTCFLPSDSGPRRGRPHSQLTVNSRQFAVLCGHRCKRSLTHTCLKAALDKIYCRVVVARYGRMASWALCRQRACPPSPMPSSLVG